MIAYSTVWHRIVWHSKLQYNMAWMRQNSMVKWNSIFDNLNDFIPLIHN